MNQDRLQQALDNCCAIKQRDWDGKTDSGSRYFKLRQLGYSHENAVYLIEHE